MRTKFTLAAGRCIVRDGTPFATIHGVGQYDPREVDKLARQVAALPELVAALEEIARICSESASDCRKRMGTRAGNSLVAARAALAKVES